MTEVKTKAGSSVPVRSATGYFVLAGLVAGIVGAAIGYSLYSESLSALGIPDPGVSVSFGLPFVRGLATMFGFIGVGSFLMSALAPLHEKMVSSTSTGIKQAEPAHGAYLYGLFSRCSSYR